MQITATTYIDFLLSNGLTRVRRVREARRMYEAGYAQGIDYYRPLREGIISMHRAGGDVAVLEDILEDALPRKHSNYQECIDGYRKFMKDKTIVWERKPKSQIWSHAGLNVVINPELRMVLDGRPYRVKLYLKGDRLTQRRADLLIALLHEGGYDGSANLAIVDVRRARLFTQKRSSPDFGLLLRSEALSFVAMWEAVGEQGSGRERPAM